MTPDEFEARSWRYSRGVWVVPLSSGRVAAWTHPLGQLLGIFESLDDVPAQRVEAQARLRPTPRVQLDLSGIDL